MKVLNKKDTSTNIGLMSKNIITASLAFTLSSSFTTFKPIGKVDIASSQKSKNEYNDLKIESDAYDMLRR